MNNINKVFHLLDDKGNVTQASGYAEANQKVAKYLQENEGYMMIVIKVERNVEE